MTIELHVQPRDTSVHAQRIREQGNIPAVFYGRKEASTPISVSKSDFTRVWARAGGSAIVTLVGVGEDKDVLIQDVATNPVTDEPIHIDFYCVEVGKKVTVSVPLEFVGEAPAEKLGGIVTKALHEIEIEVDPRNIPQYIEVHLEALTDLDSSITIADLHLPDEYEITADPTETVASVVLPQEEDEEERDISDIEIVGEKKDDNEAEDSGDTKEE